MAGFKLSIGDAKYHREITETGNETDTAGVLIEGQLHEQGELMNWLGRLCFWQSLFADVTYVL